MTAIRIENVSKAYRLGLADESHDTLTTAALSWIRAPFRNFRQLRQLNTFDAGDESSEGIHWALRDVHFDVQEGDVVGIIGRNGAGKSTLLKILSRITEPTAGRVIIRGRVSSLLEVGTGFHPELTGRENIYMNGTILGMRKKEIDRKFDQIVDFSGVSKFIDTPVKRYSSGMKVRLAFAVAAHLEPEILVIDEVLAVGDLEFQNRCLGKMGEVSRSGRTVLFVSHNMAAVDALCNRGVMLHQGRVLLTGDTASVIQCYSNENTRGNAIEYRSEGLIRRVSFGTVEENNAGNIGLGDTLRIWVRIAPEVPIADAIVALAINDNYGRRIIMAHTKHQYPRSLQIEGERELLCELPDIRLAPSLYTIDVMCSDGARELARIESALQFEVIARDIYGTGTLPKSKNAIIHPEIRWSCEGI